ncbi:MAG: TerB family tellurite resistance protein [Deltaproteobacteria bacterium]|nr:MAG: TerB family tellurite resistance protein [Deltaproteobacteria bacterium]
MEHLDFTELTETERVATYGAFFAMAGADGSVDDEELVNIFECLDLEGMSETAQRVVRGFVLEPPELADTLTPLQQSANDVRYGVLVHLMDVALADTVYAPGEQQAIREAGELLGANQEQLDAIEQFIREVRGIERGSLGADEAEARLKAAGSRLDKSGVPRKSLALSGSVAAASAGGVGAAAIAGLGVALAPGVGLAVASGAAAFFAMRLITGGGGKKAEKKDPAETERVIEHLQHAIEETRQRISALEEFPGDNATEAHERREHAKHLNRRIDAMQRLLARKRGELR